jgi:hypothetical protein
VAAALVTARDALAGIQKQRVGRHGVVTLGGGSSGAEMFTVRPAEVEMLMRCQHPFVLKLYSWEPGGVLIVERALIDVGELVWRCTEQWSGGGDGDDRSNVTDGDVVLRLYLAATACIALAHIHSCGVMHMDIKYNNVMVQSAAGVEAAGGDLQRIVSRHRRLYPWLGHFVLKLIDFSRAASIPSAVSVLGESAAGAGGASALQRVVPPDAVRVNRAGERYRPELAPELWVAPPLQPFHCPATDVYAMVKRVLGPLFRHPAPDRRDQSMLRALTHKSAAVASLDAALLAALAHAPSQRPTAAALSHLLVDALNDVAARRDVDGGGNYATSI